ncbi:amidohydrolase [Streptomyces fuscigenes]|uniref:amidohydrolase n=1 Tax=Streptomyces fuscigenes TaxID=1528880 RepID=UPI001F434A4A|nr:amidohydrolase [Streptomyces fuscigenes]MCF3964086.1 amidohydrolase [Streptomyces fuscigenes]
MPEAHTTAAHVGSHRIDLVVRGADVHTLDPDRPRASALAVRDGRVAALGTDWDIESLVGPNTRVVDAGGRMVMPGLVDVHAHLGFGGQAAAWELTLPPMSGVTEILGSVRDRARALGPDDWVVGGVLVGPVFQAVGNTAMLAALDEVSEGRPVMLRDESLHNRWVNSRALEILGVGDGTADPPGGRYVRDAAGRAVGLLLGAPAADAEAAARRAVADPRERDAHSARTAVSVLNSVGVTAVQDAATMGSWLDVFTGLDRDGELDAWVVGSLPAREFIEPGPVGPELFDTAPERRSPHVRPDFVKAVLDGVPATRTSKFLEPYRGVEGAAAVAGGEPTGESLFTDAELVLLLEEAVARGLHAKLHATADGAVRQVLDAVQRLRERHGGGPVFHLAHPEFVHPDDVPRFRDLGVVADASPVLWFPNPMNGIIAQQVQEHYMQRIWPLRELHEAGALIAAGSDWPVATGLPNPWLSIETMVTRRNPDPTFPGDLAPGQAVDLATAIRAHTVNAARAAGLSQETGRLRPGMSADFIILDRQLHDIPVEEIHATRVLQTWFAGRQVFSHRAQVAA